MENRKCKLILEDGKVFHGDGFGADNPVVGEIVFNTSMVGYTEIISDPAYIGKIVVMTYPLMGQYGVTEEDMESRMPGIAGLVVRENCVTPSNFRFTKTLDEALEDKDVPGLSGVDTRMITTLIREKGSMKAAIVDENTSDEDAIRMIAEDKRWTNPVGLASCSKRWFSRVANHRHDVVIIDCGVKQSIIKALTKRGCNVSILPFNSTAEEIMAFNPDGIMVSSGPGNPEDIKELADVIRTLTGKVPVFGMGLGHQLICMAYGASAVKLNCGRYGDSPVRSTETGKIVTTQHAHSYAIDRASLENTGLDIIFESIMDNVVEGVCCTKDHVCSVQFCPEGGPGPEETDFFDRFVKEMED